MKALLLFLVSVAAWADSPVTITLRGHAQTLVHLQAPSGTTQATVIFLPGDGGWRGSAVSMARTISSFGYDVYGFDTKDYLQAFSQNGAKLSQSQLAADMRTLAVRASGGSARVLTTRS